MWPHQQLSIPDNLTSVRLNYGREVLWIVIICHRLDYNSALLGEFIVLFMGHVSWPWEPQLWCLKFMFICHYSDSSQMQRRLTSKEWKIKGIEDHSTQSTLSMLIEHCGFCSFTLNIKLFTSDISPNLSVYFSKFSIHWKQIYIIQLLYTWWSLFTCTFLQRAIIDFLYECPLIQVFRRW